MPSTLEKLQNTIIVGNIPQMVMILISYALEMGSSDIHIEPQEEIVRLRYRVDGKLKHIIEYPHNLHPAVVSRIKITSNLKIDEQRIPQDGRTQVATEDRRALDLRVSTLPTVNGEKIVMRIQDKSKKIPELSVLGITGNSAKFIEQGLASPNGVMLTSGPTGSGKTTTLYSCLTKLNTTDVNIMTVEDPVEIQLNGLNQSQIQPDIGYSFATGLRTALRQDPDIIMVGEIRDKETIDIAIEASLTGHLVLSTIHTNSAIDTLVRIGNMGVPNFLMTAAINIVIAQRLVRKVCEKCKQPVKPSVKELEVINKAISTLHEDEKKQINPKILTNITLYKGKGCEICENSGYKGRVGLYEVFKMTNNLIANILAGKNSLELERIAMSEGMVSLEQCGIIKALQGITTLEEVYSASKKHE